MNWQDFLMRCPFYWRYAESVFYEDKELEIGTMKRKNRHSDKREGRKAERYKENKIAPYARSTRKILKRFYIIDFESTKVASNIEHRTKWINNKKNNKDRKVAQKHEITQRLLTTRKPVLNNTVNRRSRCGLHQKVDYQ